MSEELEATIRAHFDAGELEKAATVAVEGYGRELLGYLVATLRDEDAASDVFAQTTEALWRGLARFQWRSSLRTWCYVLARNAAGHYLRAPANQAHRRAGESKLADVADRVRTATMPYLRTEVKDRFEALRASLDPEDQSLLILRVNRRMSWKEVAQVLAGVTPDDEAALVKAAARFRQRFQAVKKRMHELAEREGLLDLDLGGA